ncbi:MAG: calcium-binding EGF-like domain-containing protein [Myxococcales bacterium]|nr:calcium-binding EGF-like domain-containing protein [Myxococcales bacterium]
MRGPGTHGDRRPRWRRSVLQADEVRRAEWRTISGVQCVGGGRDRRLVGLAGGSDDAQGESDACEVDLDECKGAPCKNGGTCKDGAGTYTCDCAAGFGGDQCENELDECAVAPCKNGGTCTDGLASFTCSCALGYDGPTCSGEPTMRRSTSFVVRARSRRSSRTRPPFRVAASPKTATMRGRHGPYQGTATHSGAGSGRQTFGTGTTSNDV